MPQWQRQCDRGSGIELDIEVNRLGGRLLDHALDLAQLASDHFHLHPGRRRYHGYLLGGIFLITRRTHLVACRQVEPQLEAAHQPFHLLGHFRMHDAAPGTHPLHAARAKQPLVTVIVTVAHAAIEHVGDRFKAAMRVIGEAGNVIAGLVRAKGIEHQKRVKIGQLRGAQHTHQAHTGTVGSSLPLVDAIHMARAIHCSVCLVGVHASTVRRLLHRIESTDGKQRCRRKRLDACAMTASRGTRVKPAPAIRGPALASIAEDRNPPLQNAVHGYPRALACRWSSIAQPRSLRSAAHNPR